MKTGFIKVRQVKPLMVVAALWLTAAGGVRAESELSPITPEEVAQLQGQIQKIDAEAREKRTRADQDFAARNAACYQKVLVSACLEKSRKTYVAARVAIRQLEAEVRRIQREIRLREALTKKAVQDADAPEREREAAEAAARHREEAARREIEFARREAEHQQRLKEGAAQAARDAQTGAARDAENARRQQEKAAAARERAARTPPTATSSTRPYTPPAIDLPAAPSSLAPKR